MGINKAILLGRLGKDPELRYTPSGVAVAHLAVATLEIWKDKSSGEKQERTEWHRVIVWGNQAESCSKYLSKGKGVYIEGKIQTREYEKDGSKRYSTEIKADSVQFLDS